MDEIAVCHACQLPLHQKWQSRGLLRPPEDRFCSRETCRAARKVAKPVPPCSVCGEPTDPRGRKSEVRFCRAEECQAARREHRAKANRERVAELRAQGVDVYAPYREAQKASRDARIASGELLPSRKRNPEGYRKHDQIRRARRQGATIGPDFTREDVLDRDGWVCQLCGDDIPPTAEWPDPLSPSLDHVIPLARGGSHSLDNSQAAHLDCNVRAGAKGQ